MNQKISKILNLNHVDAVQNNNIPAVPPTIVHAIVVIAILSFANAIQIFVNENFKGVIVKEIVMKTKIALAPEKN